MFRIHRRSLRGSTLFAAALTCCASLSALAGVGGPEGPPVSPDQARILLAEQPSSLRTSCFWGEPAGPIDGYNALGIETHVAYWYSRLDLPVGSRVVFRGQFPHARFMSLTSYGTVGGQRGTPLAGFSDYEIEPDPGSVNPFLQGARRTASNRAYTLTVSSARAGQSRTEHVLRRSHRGDRPDADRRARPARLPAGPQPRHER